MSKRNATMVGLSSASHRQRRARPPLTRRERAMVRILCMHGWSTANVAKRMDCSSVTVYNVKYRFTASGDLDNDYEYVEESFRKEYPPINMKTENDERRAQHDEKPTSAFGQKTSASPSKSVSSHAAARASANMPSRNMSSTPMKTRAQHNVQLAAGPSRQRAIPIDLNTPEPEPEVERIPPKLPGLQEFLAGLEHDLSDILDALIKQDLGTSQKFFAIAMWSGDMLHQLFKEALPQMTVAQRFMLVKGMKAVVEKI